MARTPMAGYSWLTPLRWTGLESEHPESATVSARGWFGIGLSLIGVLPFSLGVVDTAWGDNPASGSGCPSGILL